MKYLIYPIFTLLLITPLELFSQFGQTNTRTNTIKVEQTTKPTAAQEQNARVAAEAARVEAEAARVAAEAARLKAEAARSAAMKEPTSEILIPLEVDLKNYTHIAMVSVYLTNGRDKYAYNTVAQDFLSSPLTIVNPTENMKLFNKNPLYLRDSKNSGWLYLYYTKSMVGVDEIRELVIRDSNNTVIYSSKNRNVPISQVIAPFINF
jgi:hypothetical protein